MAALVSTTATHASWASIVRIWSEDSCVVMHARLSQILGGGVSDRLLLIKHAMWPWQVEFEVYSDNHECFTVASGSVTALVNLSGVPKSHFVLSDSKLRVSTDTLCPSTQNRPSTVSCVGEHKQRFRIGFPRRKPWR